jgi:glycosyltransferase involved in cell wall biosynthesis
MHEPTVTVITCTLNRPSLLQACASVDAQTFRDWHHYVIGDGVLPADHEHPRRTTIGFSRRLGATEPALDMPYGTQNPLLRWALGNLRLGRYVCVLDDDNVYRPEFMERMVGALEGSGAGIALCALEDLRDSAAHDGYPELERCDMSAFLVRREHAQAREFPRERPDRDAISDYDFIAWCAREFGWTRVPERLTVFGAGPRVYP